MSYSSYGKDRERRSPWEYKCFKCDISFETMQKAPKCRRCGQTLKGRPIRRY